MDERRKKNSARSKLFLVRKAVSFGRRVKEYFDYAMFFPVNSMCFFLTIVYNGFRTAVKGVG